MRKTRGSTQRCLAVGVTAATLTCVVLPACVSPKDEYDDFVDRTADARAALSVVPEVDAGSFEAALPDGGFEGTYYLTCLPLLALGDVTKALSFQASFEVLPAPDGGSMAALSAIALRLGATDLSDTVGPTDMASGTLDASGVGNVTFADALTIPKEADPVSTNDVTIGAGAYMAFYVSSATDLCSGFNADVTAPLPLTLVAAQTPCVMRRFAQPSGPLPALMTSDYHCP